MVMTTLSFETYVNVLRKSQLVDEKRLNAAIESVQSSGAEDGTSALAEELEQTALITPWQNEKLLQGKHRGFFLGKYKLLGYIGAGGMSTVYLAEHTRLKRRVAIKILPAKRVDDASYLERFLLEARAIASLDHPNIVRAYDVNNEGNLYYLSMEYVEGEDLERRVRNSGVLAPTKAADFIRQAADGLAHAHKRGMIHRDIKPGNLLLDEEDTVRILDMGLARLTTLDRSLTIEHNERVLGTTDYLAPEQALNSHTIDHRADLYSLGCSLYFLLVGSPPFPSGTIAQRLIKHQVEEPKAITTFRSDVPKGLLAICKKLMAKKPEQRYQTAEEASADLLNFLKQQGVEVRRGRIAAVRTGSPDPEARHSDTLDLLSGDTHVERAADTPAIETQPNPSSDELLSATTSISLEGLEGEASSVTQSMAIDDTEVNRPAVSYRKSNNSSTQIVVGTLALVAILGVSGLAWLASSSPSKDSADTSQSRSLFGSLGTTGFDETFKWADFPAGNQHILKFSVPKDGEYRLRLHLNSAPAHQHATVKLDGKDIQKALPLYAPQAIDLTRHQLSAGEHEFVIATTSAQTWYRFEGWRVIGPFDGNLGKSHQPEKEFKDKASYKGKGNKDLKWKTTSIISGRQLRLPSAVVGSSATGTYYLHRKVKADKDGKLKIYFAHNEGLQIYCNHKQVLSQGSGSSADQIQSVDLSLKKGDNHLTVKLQQNSAGAMFYFADWNQSEEQVVGPLDFSLQVQQ